MTTTPYVIGREDLDALIEGLLGNPNLSEDGKLILLGARLNRRNNDRSVRDNEIDMLERVFASEWAEPDPAVMPRRPGRIRDLLR